MSGRYPQRSETSFDEHLQEEENGCCSCGFALSAGAARAYNEEAFRYFLNIERKRADRSGRPLVLVLVDERGPAPSHAPIESDLGIQLFGALSQGLRETDFIGWYQENRVAGAVLMQAPDPSCADVSIHVRDRIVRIIAARLPASLAGRLKVRVFQLPSKVKSRRD